MIKHRFVYVLLGPSIPWVLLQSCIAQTFMVRCWYTCSLPLVWLVTAMLYLCRTWELDLGWDGSVGKWHVAWCWFTPWCTMWPQMMEAVTLLATSKMLVQMRRFNTIKYEVETNNLCLFSRTFCTNVIKFTCLVPPFSMYAYFILRNFCLYTIYIINFLQH